MARLLAAQRELYNAALEERRLIMDGPSDPATVTGVKRLIILLALVGLAAFAAKKLRAA